MHGIRYHVQGRNYNLNVTKARVLAVLRYIKINNIKIFTYQ